MRAPPLLLLLLLMAAAGQAVNPLARLNPWLSACDLEEEGTSGARACGGSACSVSSSSDQLLAGSGVEKLCRLSASWRADRLKELRLRECCERSPWSALDPTALDEVLAGGYRCEQTLHELLRLDDMVARVHCDFRDILERYDCNQTYSRHTCDECEETYRRWACSTMIPLWVEEAGGGGGRSRRSRPAEHGARWRARHLERVGHLDRRRAAGGGGVPGRWVRAAAAGPGRPRALVRLKPCLSVCQKVEETCPYFLPADRAPAYPTQYAGEPTFLCLDERIPETGAQKNKSNYGSDDCCYFYQNSTRAPSTNSTVNDTYKGFELNYTCNQRLEEAERPDPETCSPMDERVASCSVPYQAPSGAARRPPAQLALVLAVCAAHAHRTLSPSLVNVRDSRL